MYCGPARASSAERSTSTRPPRETPFSRRGAVFQIFFPNGEKEIAREGQVVAFFGRNVFEKFNCHNRPR